jgi:hypothetical protein
MYINSSIVLRKNYALDIGIVIYTDNG